MLPGQNDEHEIIHLPVNPNRDLRDDVRRLTGLEIITVKEVDLLRRIATIVSENEPIYEGHIWDSCLYCDWSSQNGHEPTCIYLEAKAYIEKRNQASGNRTAEKETDSE